MKPEKWFQIISERCAVSLFSHALRNENKIATNNRLGLLLLGDKQIEILDKFYDNKGRKKMGISLSLRKTNSTWLEQFVSFFGSTTWKSLFSFDANFHFKGDKTCFASLGWVSNFVCLTFYSTHQSLQLLTAHIKDWIICFLNLTELIPQILISIWKTRNEFPH